MENEQLLDSEYSADLGITPNIRAFLSETARWANFIAILGFIMIGILILVAIFAGSMMGMMMSQIPEAQDLGGLSGLYGGALTVFYLILAGIYIFPILYLYRFATKMKHALRTDDQESLSSSFENLKSHYKFIGILMIIMLGLYALAILLAIVGSMMAF